VNGIVVLSFRSDPAATTEDSHVATRALDDSGGKKQAGNG